MEKTIKISEKTYFTLSELASQDDTFDDVINLLIDYYLENEEFSDTEAEFYNCEIDRFENGNLSNVTELEFKDLEKRIFVLENEI